jgi:hypothetical protein
VCVRACELTAGITTLTDGSMLSLNSLQDRTPFSLP